MFLIVLLFVVRSVRPLVHVSFFVARGVYFIRMPPLQGRPGRRGWDCLYYLRMSWNLEYIFFVAHRILYTSFAQSIYSDMVHGRSPVGKGLTSPLPPSPSQTHR